MDAISEVEVQQTPVKLPWYRAKALLLVLVSMAQMLDIINVASVTIVLPQLMVDVGYELNQLQWVVSAYALAYGGFLLIGGRLGDLFGHKRIFLTGMIWFCLWALVNGFAKNPIVMSVGRAMQGMGAGFTIPSALAILTTTFPVGPERTQAMAVFGGTGAIGSVIGVLFGGIFGSTIGWRWIFFITAILAFIMICLGIFVIPNHQDIAHTDRRIDVFGAMTFTLGIVAIIYYLSEGPSAGWAVGRTLGPFIAGLVSLVVFVIIETRIDYPIMPLHIWQSRRFTSSIATIVTVSAAINTMIYFTSLTFQNVLGYTTMQTALAYLVHGFGAIATIIVLTKLVTFVRTKILVMVGFLFFVASSVVFAQIKANSSYWSIPFPALILNFLGMAPVWLISQLNSVADAKNEDQGVVGAIFNVGLQIGGPIGIAISNVVANNKNGPLAQGAELLPGYKDAFYTMVALACFGFVVTAILAPNQDPPKMKANPEGAEMDLETVGGDLSRDQSDIGLGEKKDVTVESATASTINVSQTGGHKSEVEELK